MSARDTPIRRGPDIMPRWSAQRRAADPEGYKEFKKYRHRSHSYIHRYGITVEQYDAMYSAQQGRCAMCQAERERLFVDHHHKSGAVRDLLCPDCNNAVAHVENGKNTLAVAYIERHLTNKG